MKTIVFTMFLRGWNLRKHTSFNPTVIRKHACHPNPLFDTSNHRNLTKVVQIALQWRVQNPSKIIKNPPWDSGGYPWVNPCPTWSSRWCQTGPSRCNMMPKWCQRGRRQGAKPLNPPPPRRGDKMFFPVWRISFPSRGVVSRLRSPVSLVLRN